MTIERAPFVDSVVHPTDFSAASDQAFVHALALALLRGSRLTLLHVTPAADETFDWTGFPPVRETMERWGLLAPGSPRGAVQAKFGTRVRKLAVRGVHPVEATVACLEDDPHDLVVLATRGLDGARALASPSRAEAIAARSRTMTLFVPETAERGLVSPQDGELELRRILVPVDSAPDPARALELAHRAAQVLGLESVIITVFHAGDAMPPLPRLVDDGDVHWQTRTSRGGPAVEEIIRLAAALPADLIVMATAGSSGIVDALRGTTTQQVLRHAACPVLAVPESR